MEMVRVIVQDAAECCEPFLDLLGQPARRVQRWFPTAKTYAEFKQQERELVAILDRINACQHAREAAVQTHRTLCGNDRHIMTDKQASYFPDVPPEMLKELLGDVVNL